MARGTEVCRNTVGNVIKQAGTQADRGRRLVPCSIESNNPHLVALNTLDRDFNATASNQKWLKDMTYIPAVKGQLYVAGVLDA